MSGFQAASLSALWLGILTSISPCPLATNIAAVSFVSRQVTRPAAVLSAAIAYMAGRMFSYIALAMVLAAGLLAVPSVSFFLEKHANSVLGPMLILAGMPLLDLVRLDLPDFDKGAWAGKLAASFGAAAPFTMGVLSSSKCDI